MKFFDKYSLYYLDISSENLNLYAAYIPTKLDSLFSKAYKGLYLGYLLYRDCSYVHMEKHNLNGNFWYPLLNKFCLEREERELQRAEEIPYSLCENGSGFRKIQWAKTIDATLLPNFK
jgi:hypothetical protein